MRYNKYFVHKNYESIYKDRYEKNNEGYLGTLHRVAKFVANAEDHPEDWEQKFYELMEHRYFFPGGRTMSNADIGKKLTLNNCFVAPIVGNSMEDIFETVKLGAITHKAGGGIGYNFSNLSPKGMATNNDAIASGPVSFMDVFNSQTETVMQGSRRGANMGTLSVYHPDIMEFIYAKSAEASRLDHFNLSVIVDDEFMNAVEKDEEINLHWPIYDDHGNHVPASQWVDEFTKPVRAKEIWDAIIRKAYDNGEPGVFFEDNMRKANPASYVENIVCSNPCAEYLAGTINYKNEDARNYGGACNLGSLLLHNFVLHPFTHNATVDWENLTYAIRLAVRFLDDIIDVNKFPDPIYENYQKNMRTIGLGYTGLADMLAMLGMKYNSEEAYKYVEHLMKFCAKIAYEASIDLAKEKGCFKFCDKVAHANTEYVTNLLDGEDRLLIKQYGIRNAKIQAVAPTGTMSLTFGNNCSSGIEPIFSLSYQRKVKVGGQDDDHQETYELMDYAYWLYNEMVMNGEHVDFSPEDIFVTAMEMNVKEHILMLSIIQKYVDMSVSKTINVPTEYSFEDTKDIYTNCWKLGVKGCTIFRPNALRPGILITNESKEQKEQKECPDEATGLKRGDWKSCAPDTIYEKRKLRIGCGKLTLFIGWSEQEQAIQEIWIKRAGSGGCEKSIESTVINMSAIFRLGGSIHNIEKAYAGLGACNSFVSQRAKGVKLSKGSSCATAILNEMKAFLKEKEQAHKSGNIVTQQPFVAKPVEPKKPIIEQSVASGKCPVCGEPVSPEGGCITCKSCGWNRCGE